MSQEQDQKSRVVVPIQLRRLQASKNGNVQYLYFVFVEGRPECLPYFLNFGRYLPI